MKSAKTFKASPCSRCVILILPLSGSVSSLGSSGGGSLLQVPGALPAISHASLGSGRSSRPKIFLSTSQSIDRYSPHRLSPADSTEGCRFSPAHRINRHRLNSAHSIDGYKFSPAHHVRRHRLSSAHSMDGYRLNPEPSTERPVLRSSHSIDRHSSLRLSPTYRQPSKWLSPEDSLDRNKLSPSYVPDSSIVKRPASFRSAGRQLRRQVRSWLLTDSKKRTCLNISRNSRKNLPILSQSCKSLLMGHSSIEPLKFPTLGQ